MKPFFEQSTYIVDESGSIIVDHIGKFECLNEEFQFTCSQIAARNGNIFDMIRQRFFPLKLKHYNVSQQSSNAYIIRFNITEKALRIAAPLIKKDCELFGYDLLDL